MRRTLILFSMCIALGASQLACAQDISSLKLPDLKIGSELPENSKATNVYLMTSPSNISPEYKWFYEGVEYSVCTAGDNLINYISTTSQVPKTENGVYVGMKLHELKNILDVELLKYSGWAWVAELPSGWKAAFTCGLSMTSCEVGPEDKIVFLYR